MDLNSFADLSLREARQEISSYDITPTIVGEFIINYCLHLYKLSSSKAVHLLGLETVEGKPSLVQFYPDVETMRKRGKKTVMKVGRFLKALCPGLSDSECEQYVNLYKLLSHKEDFEILYGESREHFREAYSKNIGNQLYITTSRTCKQLSNSCMSKKAFDQWEVHPAEAYASGDFGILYAKNPKGEILGRVVLNDYSETIGPIYCTSQVVYEELEKEVMERFGKVIFAMDGQWEGEKLLEIDFNGGYLLPYVDFNEGVDENFCIVPQEGAIGVYHQFPTQGFVGVRTFTCYFSNEMLFSTDYYLYVGEFTRKLCSPSVYKEKRGVCETTGKEYHKDYGSVCHTGPDKTMWVSDRSETVKHKGVTYHKDYYNELFAGGKPEEQLTLKYSGGSSEEYSYTTFYSHLEGVIRGEI